MVWPSPDGRSTLIAAPLDFRGGGFFFLALSVTIEHMSHTAKAIVIHCMDFRFVADSASFLKNLGYGGSYDDVSIAGAVKNLVDPYNTTDEEFVYRQIAIAKKLHSITDMVLINHTDCGAYGGRATFASPEEEQARHTKDLLRAQEMIAGRFNEANFTIVPVLARIDAEGKIDFQKIA